MLKRFLIICVFLMFAGTVQARSLLTQRICLGLTAGNWQPHSLNDEPRFDSFGAAGATPYWGLSFLFPVTLRMGLELATGYWSLRDLELVESVHSLTLYPLTLSMKYWLIPDDRLAAYVSYGGGVYWGIENEAEPYGRVWRLARSGWGATVGAGFDLGISRWIGFGMRFEYRYVEFKKPVGGVDDFSGPKIGAALLFFLGARGGRD